jgi:protease YdgD
VTPRDPVTDARAARILPARRAVAANGSLLMTGRLAAPRLALRPALLAALAALAAPALAQTGSDSCEYARDNECDEARFGGTGACEDGTDSFDCAILASQAFDDSCEWAFDGECDEPRLDGVSSACRDGTDTTDCRGVPTRAAALEALFARLPADVRARLGTDSCDWAHDLECDDAAFGGTGACPAGTDASDCRGFAAGGDDSCRWASDRACDEPGIGTGACADGTDTTDCAPVAWLRGRDNACATAFDGVCNEPAGGDIAGDGTCEALTDTADCMGRLRPAEAMDHFFGRDDRYLVDATVLPFRAVGLLTLMDGGGCTGSLVGPRTVLTAAHCVLDGDGALAVPLTFEAGLQQGRRQGKARVLSATVPPDYGRTDAGEGHDWALVTLDRDLGTTLGTLPVHVLTSEEVAQVRRTGLLVDQAGYSWDTGSNLSGNRSCRVTLVRPDNAIQHECDTTRGDSGSPLLLQRDGQWTIIAVESQFFDPEAKGGAFAGGTLAVDSRAFAEAVAEAVAAEGAE